MPAAALEEVVLLALRGSAPPAPVDTVGIAGQATSEATARASIEGWVERVVVRADAVAITLRAGTTCEGGGASDGRLAEIVVPWSGRRRPSRAAVVEPAPDLMPSGRVRRPMPEDVRRQLVVVSIARARGWTEDLISGRAADTAALAERAGCSERHVRMLLPLAGLAPDLVEAAVAGRLAAGYGVARLCRGLPASWAEQRAVIPVIAPQG